MTLKLGLLLIMLTFGISCRKQVSDDQITKSQVRDRVQQAQSVQSLNEEQLADEFNKKETEFKEKVVGLIFEALSNDVIIKMLEKPKAQEAIKAFLTKEDTLLTIIKNLNEEELKKLTENPDVQPILAKFIPKPTYSQLEKILEGLSKDEINQLIKLSKVQEILQNSIKDPEIRNQIISNLSQDEISQAMELPSVQIAINNEITKIIRRNNDEVQVLIESGKNILDDLKISIKRKTSVENVLKPNTSDLYLKFELSTKQKKYDCDQMNEMDTYWKDLLTLMSNKQKLLGVGANFFENIIKSCLVYERLNKSMSQCNSPFVDDIKKICESSLK